MAGCEAAWFLASRGIGVTLLEMRPQSMTPAHRTGNLGELVCSNSLKSDVSDTAQGLLKSELDALGSIVLETARMNRVPAGKALAVDRDRFGQDLTVAIEGHPRIRVVRAEKETLPENLYSIVATGPLTSDRLSIEITRLLGEENLYFYDAIAPTVEAGSIDFERTFSASRYGSGEEGDYVNCPVDREGYLEFHRALVEAEVVRPHSFEKDRFFSGCIPIEEIARRGKDAPRFGPMRPVGLIDPGSGKRPYAVLQLRREDFGGTMYHMVGFQTCLKYGEQERVFRLIPALGNARFLRYGSVHRNTFVNSPRTLSPFLSFPREPVVPGRDRAIFFAGQITGVEGYVECVASGLVAAMNVSRLLAGREPVVPPPTTMIGSLIRYLNGADPENFQPMNANFGLLPPLGPVRRGKRERRMAMAERSLADLENWLEGTGFQKYP